MTEQFPYEEDFVDSGDDEIGIAVGFTLFDARTQGYTPTLARTDWIPIERGSTSCFGSAPSRN